MYKFRTKADKKNRRIKICGLLSAMIFAAGPWLAAPAFAADPSDDVFDLQNLEVKLTPTLPYLEVDHNGRKLLIMRHQDPDHSIDPPYQKTSRNCPPFCIQPMRLAPEVETIGELELLAFLKQASQGDDSVLIIDSRTRDEVDRGTIPGSVSIPYTRLDRDHTTAKQIAETMQFEFGAIYQEGLWNFAATKTLVLFCNGPWCGQSPTSIKLLLSVGYPGAKIKWYRGGMQAWEQFGLTTVKRRKR